MTSASLTIRRKGAILGLFSHAEMVSLLAKGKLLPTDEVSNDKSGWISLRDYLSSQQAPPAPGLGRLEHHGDRGVCFVHVRGQRVGPLEVSKLEAMLRADVLTADATVETPGMSPPYPSLAVFLGIPTVPRINPNVSWPKPIATPIDEPDEQPVSQTQRAAVVERRTGYLQLWWKTTLVIFVVGVLLGYLSNGPQGMGMAIGAGLIGAPLKGAFWAWIIWVFRR